MTGSASQSGRPVEPARLRNIGIVAHINAGKTTLTERILFDTGRQRTLGDVESGTATMDWLREEQERGISIAAAVTAVSWRDHRVQIVDTPGHVDFAAEVERCLRVLDGAVVVLDAVRGVETQTETVWRSIERLRVPRVAFVNKMDRATADFGASVAALESELGARPLQVVVPIVRDGEFVGMIDAVARRYVTWGGAPAPAAAIVDALYQAVIDVCGDRDEAILADFVQGRAIHPDRLHAAIREATLACELVPVFSGSALHNRGVEPLLDGACAYLPSPFERDESEGDAASFLALVFKVQDARDGSGPEALVRVFRGRVGLGDEVETAVGDRFSLASIQEVHAMERAERVTAGVGEIVAVRTPRLLRTGETLRAPGAAEVLERLRFSTPVLARAVEPQSETGRRELVERARALAVEDPTLEVDEDLERGVVEVRGMGELHLEVFAGRLTRELPVPPRFGRPSVVRRETIAAPAPGEAEVARQLGPHSIRARARVMIEPLPEQDAPLFRWAVSEGASGEGIRADVLAAVEARARGGGFASPHPLGGVAVEILELEEEGPADMVRPLLHEAVGLACRRALQAGGLRFAEPWVALEVAVPVDATGAVLADLQSRGAQITEVGGSAGESRIEGRVALARVLGYATELRSMTRGRGRFELRLTGFEAP